MQLPNHRPRHIPAGGRPEPGAGTPAPAGTPRTAPAPAYVTTARPGATGHRQHRRSSQPSLLHLTRRLSARDKALARLLVEHRFLTTEQIAAVLFNTVRTCRNRLNILRGTGFVDWFAPTDPRSGRRVQHWIAGPSAARYVALTTGENPPSLRAVRDRQDRIALSGYIPHADGTNQFFVDLLAHSRTTPGSRLLRWWSSPHTAAAVDRGTRPDGHGVWRAGDRVVPFLLEHDTGTESLTRIGDKLAAYRKLRQDGPPWTVLFWLPNRTRETNLHHKLAGYATGTAAAAGGPQVVAATASRDAAANPAGPVWWLLGEPPSRRYRLDELPADFGTPAGPYHPAAPTPDEDPLDGMPGPGQDPAQNQA